MLIISLLLIIGGLVSIFYLYPKKKNQVMEMQFMQTKPIRELREMFNTMRESGLEDSYTEFVELKGRIVTEGIKTPFSGREVAYFESTVSSVNEVEKVEYDDKGNRRTTMVKEEHLISNEESSHTVGLRDASTDEVIMLEINSSGCTLDIPKTWDRLDPNFNFADYETRRSYRSQINRMGSGRFLGYRTTERTIDKNAQLYVLGEAFKSGDTIHIGKPKDPKKPFLVTTKSEENMVKETQSSSKVLLFGGIGAVVVGILLFFVR
ncbi:MAG: GIDE domain-containing protein [Filifactor alocis]|nr:GIDE domain-containing protein [Filifactor alocis]